MTFLKKMCVVVMVPLLFLAGCQEEEKAKPKSDSVYTVKKEHFENALFYSGTLMPLHIINIPAPADGVVVDVNFKYGQSVKKNDWLLKINSDQLQKDYNDALTAYLGAKDKLESAKSKYKSSKELFRLGIISEENYKADKSEFDNANMNYLRSVYAIQSTLKTTHGSFDNIKDLKISDINAVNKALKVKYNNLNIIARGSGVALAPPKVTNDDNGKVMLGSEVKRGQVLLAIGDLDGVSVDINVTEIDIEKIKRGEKVEISGVAFPNVTLQGYVSQVDSQAASSNAYTGGLPSFQAKVIVPKLTAKQKKVIRVGMSAKIRLVANKKNVIMVPYAAVEERDGESWVRIVDAGEEKEVRVVTGETSYDKVEIKKGIKVGDKILLHTDAA